MSKRLSSTTLLSKGNSSKKIKTKNNSTTNNEKLRINPIISSVPLQNLTSNDSEYLKIVSWNVCGFSAITKKGSLQAYVEQEKPDILCLQETRLTTENVSQWKGNVFPTKNLYPFEYHNCSTARLGYSGTAIFSKIKPLSVNYKMGIEEFDKEGRCITVEYENFYLICTYVPNSGDKLRRLDVRRKWNKQMEENIKWLSGLTEKDKDNNNTVECENAKLIFENTLVKKPVIWCGDLNVAHHEIDLYDPKGHVHSSCFTPEERADFSSALSNASLVDVYRQENPNAAKQYTFWSYRAQCRPKNNGWRLDYALVQHPLVPYVHKSFIRSTVYGSDHCPVGILLKKETK